jgi:hypothetical protein
MRRLFTRWKRQLLQKHIATIIITLLVLNVVVMWSSGCDGDKIASSSVKDPTAIDVSQFERLIDEQNETINLQKDTLRLKQARIDYLESLNPKGDFKSEIHFDNKTALLQPSIPPKVSAKSTSAPAKKTYEPVPSELLLLITPYCYS